MVQISIKSDQIFCLRAEIFELKVQRANVLRDILPHVLL